LLLGAVAALGDFYRWGYEYGHNLDPNAAIQVPGMSYQPPVIGYKNLLNFGAWSLPDVGGWVFVVAGAMVVGVYVREAFLKKSSKGKIQGKAVGVTLAGLVLLSACAVEPEPICYGKDNCYFCKMSMADTRFGAEIVTKKGKVYKFDDINCLLNYLKVSELPEEDIALQLVVDFSQPEKLIPAEKAFFLMGSTIQSPMNSQIAAFETQAAMEKAKHQLQAEAATWKQVQEKFGSTTAHRH